MIDDLRPLEIAARAIVRVDTVDYPNTKAGRERADAYVDANWRATWETLWETVRQWEAKQ